MINLVIIDGQEKDRKNIEMLLSTQSDFKIVGRGKDWFDTLKLVPALMPDVLLLDINLADMDSAKAISIIKCRSPNTLIIILTNVDDDECVCDAICGGVSGYLLKNRDTEKLADSIRTVYDGGSLLSPYIATKAFRMFSKLIPNTNQPCEAQTPDCLLKFSRTEMQIMSLVGQGLSNQEIAQKTQLRNGTVRNCISSILQKANLRDRTQIAIFAITNGLIRKIKLCSSIARIHKPHEESCPNSFTGFADSFLHSMPVSSISNTRKLFPGMAPFPKPLSP